MGFFSSLFRSRDAPQDRTAGSGYTFYFGGTTSGKAVTERSAHADDGGVFLRPHLGGGCGWPAAETLRYTGDGGKEKSHRPSAVSPAP